MGEEHEHSSRLHNFVAFVVLLAIAFSALVPIWYYFYEIRQTEEQIQAVSAEYDDRIAKLTSDDAPFSQNIQDKLEKVRLLKELHIQKRWEQSHERVNRRYVTLSAVVEWIIILIILFLAVWQEKAVRGGTKNSTRSVAIVIPVFAALAIAVPAITQKLGFDGRQKLHDFRAQQIGFIIFELDSDLIAPESAWDRYKNLYRQSPSSIAEFPSLN